MIDSINRFSPYNDNIFFNNENRALGALEATELFTTNSISWECNKESGLLNFYRSQTKVNIVEEVCKNSKIKPIENEVIEPHTEHNEKFLSYKLNLSACLKSIIPKFLIEALSVQIKETKYLILKVMRKMIQLRRDGILSFLVVAVGLPYYIAKTTIRIVLILIETVTIFTVQACLLVFGGAKLLSTLLKVFTHNQNIKINNTSNHLSRIFIKFLKVSVTVFCKAIIYSLRIVPMLITGIIGIVHESYNFVGRTTAGSEFFKKSALMLSVVSTILTSILVPLFSVGIIAILPFIWALAIPFALCLLCSLIYVIQRDHLEVGRQNDGTIRVRNKMMIQGQELYNTRYKHYSSVYNHTSKWSSGCEIVYNLGELNQATQLIS